jgi:hypothetical protein
MGNGRGRGIRRRGEEESITTPAHVGRPRNHQNEVERAPGLGERQAVLPPCASAKGQTRRERALPSGSTVQFRINKVPTGPSLPIKRRFGKPWTANAGSARAQARHRPGSTFLSTVAGGGRTSGSSGGGRSVGQLAGSGRHGIPQWRSFLGTRSAQRLFEDDGGQRSEGRAGTVEGGF